MKRLFLALILYPLSLCLSVEAAEQARGFNTVLGVATSDRIQSALTSHSTQRTWVIWANRRFDANAEYWNKGNGTESLTASFAQGVVFRRTLSQPAQYSWNYNPPATGGWTHIAVTYDSSTPTTAPLVYYNGVAQTPASTSAATGTAITDSNPYVIGNRAAADRAFDGTLSQFAVWDRILTPTEIATLATTSGGYNGLAPSCYATNLVEYIKLTDQPVTSSVLANPTVTGTAQQTGLDVDYTCGKAALGVTITSPTSSPTYDNGSSSTIALGGTATSATSITWANDRGGSGSATGTSTWSIASVTLSAGSNVITVTAGDGSTTVTDTVTVTYTAPSTVLIGGRRIVP